jgi:hypothetical protein
MSTTTTRERGFDFDEVADKVCHAVFGVPLSEVDAETATKCRRAATIAATEVVQQVAALMTEQRAAYARVRGG